MILALNLVAMAVCLAAVASNLRLAHRWPDERRRALSFGALCLALAMLNAAFVIGDVTR